MYTDIVSSGFRDVRLLPLLKSIQKPTHLRHFAGQTLGVDAYGWLHRGTVACAIELAEAKPTRKHIDFALSRVRMLIHFGVKPFLVFDGDYLPSKAHTETERAARRKESKRAGLELLRMGKVSQAHLELQKAIDVTTLMARELIEELKKLDVPYIVAPYEADSQMVYLEKQGIVQGILSEDSDLLVFGTKCLLTKLDQHGECVMIKRADFTACREISLVGWTDKEFRMMAMLSGCDYLPGIGNMGLKTAYRLVRKHKLLDRVVRTVQFDGKMKVPAGYLEAFAKAEHTFLYQWVFCPESQRLVNLSSVPAELNVADMEYIGHDVEPHLAAGVAAGDLDPNTKKRLVLPSVSHHPASRTRLAQTPDEKQGKPISEFFKARRTPLAELDPNSFTPSPSQQRLLEAQHITAWSTSKVLDMRPPAPARALLAPGPAPQPSRRVASTPTSTTSRNSPKRQRLCSDSVLAASMGGTVGMHTATSRFFSLQAAQPSPSLRKVSRQKAAEGFELYADALTAEAGATVAASEDAREASTTLSPRKRKKLAVYADSDFDAAGSQPAAQGSQNNACSPAPTHSICATVAGTPATSLESETAQTKRSIFSKGVDVDFAVLKSRWAFSPSTTPRTGPPRTKPPPGVLWAPLQLAERNDALNGLSKPGTMPMASTMDHNNLPRSQVLVPGSSPPVSLARVPLEAEVAIADDEWLAMEQCDVSPTIPLAVKGSEDFLVPNSPSSDEDGGRLRPKLDLGRFAFAA
ncbi:Rad2 nuclease [Teratosphaeriaceae sp. CCFEE 6253]|nr:Rad2 nuclease [Teratosphaeriaceae sp. CCFEE 6253]